MQKRHPSPGRPAGSVTHEAELAAAFGSVVRRLREARNMAQEHLANLADVERSHMGKLERGQHMPTLAVVFKIANALEQSPAALMAGTEELLKDRAFTGMAAPTSTKRRRISKKADKRVPPSKQ